MDDDLMRLFGGERMKNLMSRIGMEPGEPIYHPWLNKSIEKAQKKVEERNFEIRKHLLEYDDVLNEQRNFIYDQRNSILADEDLDKRVIQTAEETVEEFIEKYQSNMKKNAETALSSLQDEVKNTFGLQLESSVLSSGAKIADIQQQIITMLRNDLEEKEALAGKENINMFIRYQYIQSIDRRWLDHLEELEALREAVYLRSYGSKNPLTEYKLEGFEIFYQMLDAIRLEIASKIFRIKIQSAGDPGRRQARQVNINAQHTAMESFNSGGTAAARPVSAVAARGAQGDSVTVVRTGEKVGRNDPCPCGSGKKYKKCCGR